MPFTDVRKVLLITTKIPSCFSLANMYHYPPLVIMAESQPRLYFKYNGSLREGTDAVWDESRVIPAVFCH